jgi:hypothetical protein
MKFAIAGEESKIQSRAEPVWGADSGGYGGHWVRGSEGWEAGGAALLAGTWDYNVVQL